MERKTYLTIRMYLVKMKGQKRLEPRVRHHHFDVFIAWLGAFLGIGVVALLSLSYHMPLLVASFGASAVLLYGVPDSPLAQPRNVFFGHTISATVGVIAYALLGLNWWSASIATATAIALMLLTHTAHPPGGATALVAVLSKAAPMYILTPVALGAAILIIIALITNNLSPRRSYPMHWF
ncbi:MAG: HPP family protein [Peptococcaceae bacterium]|nr:HPP family protein [Peptococcaceae bacterium]